MPPGRTIRLSLTLNCRPKPEVALTAPHSHTVMIETGQLHFELEPCDHADSSEDRAFITDIHMQVLLCCGALCSEQCSCLGIRLKQWLESKLPAKRRLGRSAGPGCRRCGSLLTGKPRVNFDLNMVWLEFTGEDESPFDTVLFAGKPFCLCSECFGLLSLDLIQGLVQRTEFGIGGTRLNTPITHTK